MIKDDIKKELTALIQDIETMSFALSYIEKLDKYTDEEIDSYEETIRDLEDGNFILSKEYNKFYGKACRLLKNIMPERLEEFQLCYMYSNNSKQRGFIRNISTYFMKNAGSEHIRFDRSLEEQTYDLFIRQRDILESAYELIDSVLYDIENRIQYNIFSNELEAAQHLFKNKYIRPAGVIAGVALESHLKYVCQIKPNITIKKKDTLGNFIEHLRTNQYIDSIMDRKLLRLTDIRNLCGHKRDREPTEAEVQELITGVAQILVEVN